MRFSENILNIFSRSDNGLEKSSKGFSGKPDLRKLLGDISRILDPLDIEVVVVRNRGCKVVFTNKRAGVRMYNDRGYAHFCKTGYSTHFQDLCAHCPYGGTSKGVGYGPYEIEDKDKRRYNIISSIINWIDNKPAAVFILRDITAEIEANERLYTLAYYDQLTCVPNRQRLRDDFSAIEERIAKGELSGIIALFDLDYFKTVNDTYGHNTGDIVLRRLTEHLQGEQAFKGHIYRLGGDEFVLLYSDPADRFGSEQEITNHYCELLSAALRAYTLPNINVKCTLSIGVSVFPAHGTTLSEVLRKADIALYQAKAGGRNQIVFFADEADTAQKQKDMYINIQPVLNGDGETFGYELADRGFDGEVDDKTVSLNEFNRTLEALGLNDPGNDLSFFIAYSKQLLSPATLMNLPREKFIVQMKVPKILTKDELHGELQTFFELRRNGYKLALTDMRGSNLIPELLSVADYCKFSYADEDLAWQKKAMATNKRIEFIASAVNSAAGFQAAKDAGFRLFQGYYFGHPATGQRTSESGEMKANCLRLLKLSSIDDSMDFREVSSIIASDAELSRKLLRILNSAAVGMRNVSSLAGAVAYMGEKNLKKWVAVLAFRGIAECKPPELGRLSLIRARFGEILAPHFQTKHNPQHIFMTGMLSLLHIALDKTKRQLFEDISVADDIRSSLLTGTGAYSGFLRFYEDYEYANWEAVSSFIEENQLDASLVNDAYISSVKWYSDLTK